MMPTSPIARVRGSSPLRAWGARAVVMVSALLQLAVTPAVAVAEGRLAQQSGLACAHVEAERSTACVAAHASDCALCQFLSGTAVPKGADAALLAPATAQGAPRDDATRLRALDGRGPPSTRAPPVLG